MTDNHQTPAPPLPPAASRIRASDIRAAHRLWARYAPAWAQALLLALPVKEPPKGNDNANT